MKPFAESITDWLEFYRYKFESDVATKAKVELFEIEREAHSFGIYSAQKQAEVDALRILAEGTI
jgi:hypothetical protein